MTQEVERRTVTDVVRGDRFREELELALPEGVSPKRFARIAYTALLDNPDLANADEQSVLGALLHSAADGLMPDGREAALVLFKGKAAYLPMIGGYRKIAGEHGWTLETRTVFEADDFDVELGDEPRVKHRPAPPAEDPGKITHVYAVGRRLGMPTMVEVMSVDDVERVRKTSRNADKGPWVEWWDRMAEKTVGRRLFKRLPLGDRDADRIRRVIDADELEPAEAATLVYGREESPALVRETPPATDVAQPSDPDGSDREEEPGAEGAAAEAEGSSVIFTGKEPPEEDPLELVLHPAFKRYAGKTIRDVVEAGDRRYLVWLTTDANVQDETIVAAARAGLAELES